MLFKIIDKPTIMALLVAAVFFMENLDATIITTSIPYIAHDFHVTPESLSVGISAYMISITVLLPISGWISDRFGANKIFPLGILIFTLSSILCALSVNLLTFTISRVLQGLGGAIMVPVGRLVVLRATDKDGVIKAIAILTWPALVAPILGPVLGGWISTFWGWRWIFLINIPFGVIAIWMSLIYVVESQKDVERIDVLGFFWAGLGCCCVMAGIEMASRQNLPILISSLMLISGIVFLFMLYRHVKKISKPIFSLSLLTYKTFRVTIAGGSLFRTAVNAAPFLVPLTFQIGFGWSAIDAGTMLLYLFAGNLLMKLFTTTLINKLGFKKILLLNGLGGALCYISLAFLNEETPYLVIAALMFCLGITRSMQLTAYNTLCFADVSEVELRDATIIFSILEKMNTGMGISLGALLLTMGALTKEVLGNSGSFSIYNFAFFITGILVLLSIIDCLSLAKNSGHRLLIKRKIRLK